MDGALIQHLLFKKKGSTGVEILLPPEVYISNCKRALKEDLILNHINTSGFLPHITATRPFSAHVQIQSGIFPLVLL